MWLAYRPISRGLEGLGSQRLAAKVRTGQCGVRLGHRRGLFGVPGICLIANLDIRKCTYFC